MDELLPGRQTARLSEGLLDYLTTTFSLADTEASEALREFLADEVGGLLKGPYVRTGLPFSPAPKRAVPPLDWLPPGFVPYAHQMAAFQRLSSRDSRPQPTLITTGTGSGKTEAFLLPIIDHCLRARRALGPGIKALILYPMNALANDQAQRLARLLTQHGPGTLGGLSAAMYTGEDGPKRTTVSEDGLITDRAVIRDNPPDILLTNYKMLDHLLLRADDQRLWRASAETLTYLVLDEFHTYDGAQGTDVAMLLRRLGMALKAHWPARGGAADTHTDTEWARPLGRVTPVGTSATLGPRGEGPSLSVVDFATTVFGERFDDACVIGEQRVTVDDWAETRESQRDASETVAAFGQGERDAQANLAAVLQAMYLDEATGTPQALLKGHDLTRELLRHTNPAIHLTELTERLIPGDPDTFEQRRGFITALLDALAHLRATGRDGEPDRGMPSTEVHLWVREVSRLDRVADAAARFRWGDDGPSLGDDATLGSEVAFPAVYCRQCGRSGWGVELAPIGDTLSADDANIRRRHAAKEGRFRALLHAPGRDASDGGTWFDPRERRITQHQPEESTALRVQTHRGKDADDLSRRDVCPCCHQEDAIRFVGSAIATLMSVALSTIFGDPALAQREKKALVFTDSVQDAAHRAGFVTARSHTLTLRSVLAAAGDLPRSLPSLVDAAIEQAGDDPVRRYRLLPGDLAARDEMRGYWHPQVRGNKHASGRVRQRLLFDTTLEFGLTSAFGRTLERTGTMSAHVDIAPAGLLTACRDALAQLSDVTFLDELDDPTVLAWGRGVLERMRHRGGIYHDWLRGYLAKDGNRWQIWGGRPRRQGMPAFPDGRSAPAFPREGAKAARSGLLDPITTAQAWYAEWAKRSLSLTGPAAPMAAKALFTQLAKHGPLTAITTENGATVYAIDAKRILVAPSAEEDLEAGRHLLACTQCRSEFPVSRDAGDQLAQAPCLHRACPGRLERKRLNPGNYYRHLYRSSQVRQVVAREHTGLLKAEQRLAYEDGFKASGEDPSAPNVLVATPTLEMGIDIGDLSSVLLASLPRSVANYVQRVGRAGRLTGNAFNIAFVRGRGDNLLRLAEPLSLIDGTVTAPATYLSAEEILRRQYLAHLADAVARDPHGVHPRTAAVALERPSPGRRTFLGDVIARAHEHSGAAVRGFLAAFHAGDDPYAHVNRQAADALVAWATPDATGGSELARTIGRVVDDWESNRQELRDRLQLVQARLPDLESRAPDSDDDKRALKEARAEAAMLTKQLHPEGHQYWISVLERLGLLPNYTLVDDSVTLDVTMSWVDAETGQYQSEQADYSRASANALRDFAPGATFYAGGHRIAIDAVEIGHNATAIVTLRLCPECGYVHERPTPLAACPRCGDTGISDIGQRFESVELTKVSAYLRRDETRIGDEADDRVQAGFVIVPVADIDPDRVVNTWHTHTGLGVTYLRGMDLRWFNLGVRRHTAAPIRIGGSEIPAPRFRICSGCGHLDKVGLANSRDEHRPWCPLRTSGDEDTRAVLLHRRLVTEGLLLTLPSSARHDVFALPSLSAAVLLGLRRLYGGAPDHLGVVSATDPARGNRDALLLHDGVPGGTGYLARLVDQDALWSVLRAASQAVRGCSCRTEPHLSCHRCLLPFAEPHHVEHTSRAAAERYLGDLLDVAANAQPLATPSWRIEAPKAEDGDDESWLEQRFRAAFLRLAGKLGAVVRQSPGERGNVIFAELGGRRFRLQPQVDRPPARPDFVLSAEGLPDVAIFTDGWAYHASPQHNLIADDAVKRRALTESGVRVLSVTAADLDMHERGCAQRPGWFDEALVSRLNSRPEFQHTGAARIALTEGSMAFLAAWLQAPDPDNLTRFGRTVAVVLHAKGQAPASDEAAVAWLPALAEKPQIRVWQAGSLRVATASGGPGAMPLAAVLDDETDLTIEQARHAWREWLWLANATMFVPAEFSRFAAVSMAAPALAPPARVADPWLGIAEEFAGEPDMLRLIASLSHAGIAPPDTEPGSELGDGIPFDLVWANRRIAVSVETPEPVEGWRVFGPDAEQIVAAWKETVSG